LRLRQVKQPERDLLPANGTVAVFKLDAIGDVVSAAVSVLLLLEEEGVDEEETRACEGETLLVEAGLVAKVTVVAVVGSRLDLDGGASRDLLLVCAWLNGGSMVASAAPDMSTIVPGRSY